MKSTKRKKAEKDVADKMGITRGRAAELIDKVDAPGWTWSERPNDQGAVRDPQRIASKCPNCGKPWKMIASVD